MQKRYKITWKEIGRAFGGFAYDQNEMSPDSERNEPAKPQGF